ncbi:MAG: hypothetical protein HYX38_29140 [Rhodospirillales bacterium]|nr:hypothetical protein [Rhodospirillales bacterium]
MGRLVEIVRQRGPAGDFLNVTWPGFAGVLTAVAPGRFAASINPAPMRRHTKAGWLLWLDYALNALAALFTSGRPPPEYVLRRAFETCATFEEACRLLARAPVANAWRDHSHGWRPRVCGEGTPIENNRRRIAAMAACTGVHPPNLEWAAAPVMNAFTRVAVEMCASSGQLVVAGWEATGRVTAFTELT